MKEKILKLLKSIFTIVIISYISFSIILYFNQKGMLYYPNEIDFFACNNFTDLEKKQYKTTRFYEIDWETNNVVIFFHWNAWSACDRMGILNILKKTNNSIIFVEYSWYSDINNNPNINDILKNVDDIWEYVLSSKYRKIFVMWRSLWTGPASYYAKKFDINKLLLVSWYSQLYKVAASKYPIFPVKLLFSENYNNEEYLKSYMNEILVIHLKRDEVIPYRFGLELFEWLSSGRGKLISIDEWTHHNIFDNTDVNSEIINYFSE